jgi:hypothetical protein
MSPEEIEAAVQRGDRDPTIHAVVKFVIDMTAVTVGESTGFWTNLTCEEMRKEAIAKFVVAMEKATVPSEG